MTDSFTQGVLFYFATHGDELPNEHWEIFHRWYTRHELEKCHDYWKWLEDIDDDED
ncbi:MAG: hypothetical protein IJG24_01065 [Selenomonadaceae bacterium]|nr:hypothetical protein [Selenomonadaceae bacterium]